MNNLEMVLWMGVIKGSFRFDFRISQLMIITEPEDSVIIFQAQIIHKPNNLHLEN